MRKTFRLFLALAFSAFGAMNVNAGERIPFDSDHFTFYNYDGWGTDANQTGVYDANFLIGEVDGCPIGDTSCNAWVDLGMYSKLYVKMEGADADGNLNGSNPRIFINRTADNGQFNADKSAAACLVIPNAGTWAEDYYTIDEDGVYVINLTKIAKEWGFVHFHSIKGSAWNTKAIVYDIEVEKAEKGQQVGWTDLINNGNMEGDDVSSFFVALDATNNQGYEPATIADGAGVDGSRGIMVTSIDNPTETWATQFFIRLNEALPEGTKWRVSFDYRADEPAAWGGGSHKEPREWFAGPIFEATPDFAPDWQTYKAEGVIDAGHAGLLSIAFDLNNSATANNYYFDNIKFEIYKSGTILEFSEDAILVDFGFDTNIPEMVKEAGTMRKFFDTASATVKVNGAVAEIHSIEGTSDGRFYIFMQEYLNETDEVYVTLNNTFGLTYTSGANAGSVIPGFADLIATYNDDVTNANIYDQPYPYDYVTPAVMKADPENGSFNLPSNTVFKLYFDKNVDCSAIEATANGQALKIEPAEGFATEISMSGDLRNGPCEVKVTKIYPEMRIADEIYGEYEFTVNIGQVEIDPNDQPETLISLDAFNNCANGGIPEGFQVNFNGEIREAGANFGAGPRMFEFAAGGDFTKGLYYREGHVETVPGVPMVAGKNYDISFNTAMWKGTNNTTFQILDAAENVVLEQVIACKPDMNGQTSVVSGSTKSVITFIPEQDGNYTLRWVANGFVEILLANVLVEHQPNIPGYKETIALQNALDAAKAVREACSGDRYAGEAWSTLHATIERYEGWSATGPSAYQTAIDELNAAAQAMNEHRANCDEFDTQIKKAIDVVRQNEMPNGDPAQATKFVTTELFQQLKETVAKYHGSSEWRNVNEDPEGEAQWQLFYTYDELKDDALLADAIAELKAIANLTSLLFTEGVSAPENANGGKATGVAVLIDRLRQGAESLKAIGVYEGNAILASAKGALTDDDQLAENLKAALKKVIYNDLSKPVHSLLQEVVDEETLETKVNPVDMTVFVKNPNIYKLSDGVDFTDESVPGWTTPEGYNRPGLTPGWGAWQGTSELAQDAMFQTWGGSYRVEQTITDLPAGVYTVRFAFGERNNGDAGVFEDSYAYVTTADGDVQSDLRGQSDKGDDMYIPGIGQAFPFANNDNQTVVIEGIEVADGQLTIGVNAGPSSHTFFNEVKLQLTAPLTGYNYEKIEDGDVNMDAAVDVADISAILSSMAAGTITDPLSDANVDGTVDVADVSKVLTIMAGGSDASRAKKAPATRADNEVTVFTAEDVKTAEDGSFDLVVKMDFETTQTLVGWNLNVMLPEGVVFNTEKQTLGQQKKCVILSEEIHPTYNYDPEIDDDVDYQSMLDFKKRVDGGYQLVWIDDNKCPLVSTHGQLLTIKLKAENPAMTGTGKIYGIGLSNNKDQGFATFGGGATIADVEFSINGGGDSDGIQDVKVAGSKSAVYNLSGQRVNGQAKGLLIQDGKKMIVK